MLPKSAHYLDWNAAAPLAPGVTNEIIKFLEASGNGGFDVLGNPSSIHSIGAASARRIRMAKADVAATVSALSKEILFCSSGTEAIQLAIHSALSLAPLENTLFIYGAADHTAVRSLSKRLSGGLLRQAAIPVDAVGRSHFQLDVLPLDSISHIVLSTLWVNNETGVLEDLEKMRADVESLRRRGLKVFWILDGAQAWGKLPVQVHATGADAVAFSGAKIGALPGSGVLWLKNPADFRPMLPGNQQAGLRGGTESVLGAIALGTASQKLDVSSQGVCADLRDRFEKELLQRIPGTVLHGALSPRVSNTSCFALPSSQKKGDWVAWLDLNGFQVSSGSACAAMIPEPSEVLCQMGVSVESALNSIRVSIGPLTSWEALSALVAMLQSRNQ
jgi:cysteine desulfurase